MSTATLLLFVIAALGAFDIGYFHAWRGRLVLRQESRREAWIHVVRGYVYALQLALVPNLRLHGAWFAALVALFVVDALVALLDVLEEPRSRAAQGGLSGGEYLMHITLSVLVGAMLHAVFSAAWGDWRLPTAIVRSEVAAPLGFVGLGMAFAAAAVSTLEGLVLLERALPPPAPIHVRVRIDAPVDKVWKLTQDHRVHPAWDHRFDRIVMLHDAEDAAPQEGPAGTPDPRIAEGSLMRYEKSVAGLRIHGFGRYERHRPLRQSTFAFWSDDVRSLIRRGIGLWLYTSLGSERTEFSTAYTYEVRWGAIGRVIDRFLFRPLFQRFTEASFRRLAREWFHEPRPNVLGRGVGRHPARFTDPASPHHAAA